MLDLLTVRAFAIIDELEVRFASGLNVLTGETGAGKTILVDALHLVLGGRAQPDVVRTGAEEAEVQALFRPRDPERTDLRLRALGLPACGAEMVVRRIVQLCAVSLIGWPPSHLQYSPSAIFSSRSGVWATT